MSACPLHREVCFCPELPAPGIASSYEASSNVPASLQEPCSCLGSQKTMEEGSPNPRFLFHMLHMHPQKRKTLSSSLLEICLSKRERGSRKPPERWCPGRFPLATPSTDPEQGYPIHNSQMGGWGECGMHKQCKEEQNPIL